MPGQILIIDDEEKLRTLLTRIIGLEGFSVIQAADLNTGMQQLKQHEVDVVLCDVKLPDGNGVDQVKKIKDAYPRIEVILLTAYGNVADGVRAIKNGAFDYIVKGDDNDRIIPLLHQAMDKSINAKDSAIKIRDTAYGDYSNIIGHSKAIRTAVSLAERSAVTDATVILLGETGTGKEVFANVIHHNSKRKGKTIVAINCSAFSRDLLEGELFGHKSGAYTGAVKDKKGLVEVADGGTLFLDEIGELNIDLQAKLLRVLENGEFIKLGDTKVSRTNVRVIAATNRNLRAEVDKGNFREDLYYRLNVFSIELPPLRERSDDIPELIEYFLNVAVSKEGRPPVRVSHDAMSLLKSYSWKGNIRELKNVIDRCLILLAGDEILQEHLPYELQKRNQGGDRGLSLAAVEKQHIRKILEHAQGNKTKAARLLGIGVATLYRKLDEYQLNG